jgi:hypothetical protein
MGPQISAAKDATVERYSRSLGAMEVTSVLIVIAFSDVRWHRPILGQTANQMRFPTRTAGMIALFKNVMESKPHRSSRRFGVVACHDDLVLALITAGAAMF